MSNAVVFTSEEEILEHPERLIAAMRDRAVISIPDLGYTTAPADRLPYVDLDDDDEGLDVSLGKKRTGIDHTIFISPRRGQHPARIKVAIDPPDAFTIDCVTTSMAVHDYSTVGAHIPRRLHDQLVQFIELNREVILEYWDGKLHTDDMIDRLKKIG